MKKYTEFSAGRAGDGRVDLATGVLHFTHEDIISDSNVLPINISHVYSSKRALETTNQNWTYGKGFKMNLQQTLRKVNDDSNDTKYLYTDASGEEHKFEDRYYYINDNGEKIYVKVSDVTIELDGKLVYNTSINEIEKSYDVLTHQITESGLMLQSELKDYIGSEKIETRHEEIVQLTEEIKQLKKTIADLNYNIIQYEKIDNIDYIGILELQKEIELTSIEIEKRSINLELTSIEIDNLSIGIDNKSIEIDNKSIDLELTSIEIDNDIMNSENTEYLKEIIAAKKALNARRLALNYNDYSTNNRTDLNKQRKDLINGVPTTLKGREELNTNQKTLLNNKNDYDDAERKELKTRNEYLKGIANTEITKYTNLKTSKEDILNKLKVQLPVNFIIGKDNITYGFNEDGNLVTMFDSYDNQVAIIYENNIIMKVVDTENREIIFEYEYKNASRGNLLSITDFKGHKTLFDYDADNLKSIIYPNGDKTKFKYNDGLLYEMVAPSQIGIELSYNENKVISIAQLTTLEKISKNGVEKTFESKKETTTLSYDNNKTVVSDAKSGESEINIFGMDGKLSRVETVCNEKIINVVAYDAHSISETHNRCNLVMTANDLYENALLKNYDEDPFNKENVTLGDNTSEIIKWELNSENLDANCSELILCGSAISTTADDTPYRMKNHYYNQNEHEFIRPYNRFEYKAVVNYVDEEPYSIYTPIKTGDTINTLYINDTFDGLPNDFVSIFFGISEYEFSTATHYYPILGKGSFSIDNRANQIYYSAKYYVFVDFLDNGFACALWFENTMLWCNSIYAKVHNITNINEYGWVKNSDSLSLSSWGSITVHNPNKLDNWAQFISKDGKFFRKHSEIDEFVVGFDYNITERQYVSMPITLRMKNGKLVMPKNITVLAHYRQSQGTAQFEQPLIVNGKVKYSKKDELENTVLETYSTEQIALDEQMNKYTIENTEITYAYNDKNLPIEKRTRNTYNLSPKIYIQTLVEKWFYNPQGSVIEYWNYIDGEELSKGINITETVYDNRGNAIKTFSYNSLDTSTKFYQEQEQAENGKVIADIDPTGTYKTSYEYDSVTGILQTATMPNGSKFSYGHDTNTDEVTAITQSTEEGEANTINRIYTAGYITEVSSVKNTINFEYDEKGRKSKVFINDEAPYATYEYQGNKNDIVTTTIAPNDSSIRYVVESETDIDGNLIRVSEGTKKTALQSIITNTYYDLSDKNKQGLLKTSTDSITGTRTEYTYNNLGQATTTTVYNVGSNSVVNSSTIEYTQYGEVKKQSIVSGAYSQEYNYYYKDTLNQELESISMPYGLNSKSQRDVNGRTTEHIISNNNTNLAGEYYTYLKQGDHATSLISSVRYGGIKNGAYSIRDRLQYKYDESGNISEIKENGKLSSRYGYDKLNRLIREDNAGLNFTSLFDYDNNGNILFQRKAAFSLCETEKLTEFMNEKGYCYDAKQPDKLKTFGNDEIYEYDAIGNPTLYRGKTLVWQKGRQLASVTDNVETLSFFYDAKGRRTGKIAEGERTRYYYAGEMLMREERCDENNIVYFGDDLLAGDSIIDGDGIVTDSTNKSVLEYIYGQDGVKCIVHNGDKYYLRKNIQGDITHILGLDGTLKACYNYDAWGNHKVLDANGNENTDPYFIGNVNPYRYRGYYFDVETGLYFLGSRYYDPEVGRFLNADSIEYLDPETINGLNLYSYCGNDPINRVDPTGNAWYEFWKWDWGKIGEGALMVLGSAAAIAISVATFGAGTPLGIAIVAGVTLGGGVLMGINGIATIGEGITNEYNFMRDGLFNEVLGLSDEAYNIYSGVVSTVVAIGTAVLGVYSLTGRAQAARVGRKFLGKGYIKAGTTNSGYARYVSKDGLRQMRFDKPHKYKGQIIGKHLNLEYFKGTKPYSYQHVLYKLFKYWII